MICGISARPRIHSPDKPLDLYGIFVPGNLSHRFLQYFHITPIQWAIINGEQESGITIMQMDQGIDTGDILMQSVVPHNPAFP